MLTKRYEAESLNEALLAARQELGEGVVVLHSKRKVVGGISFLGNLFGRECYEVLVGVAESGDSDLPNPALRFAQPRATTRAASAAPQHGGGFDFVESSTAMPQADPMLPPPPMQANPWTRHTPPAAQPSTEGFNGLSAGGGFSSTFPSPTVQPSAAPAPPPGPAATADTGARIQIRELKNDIQSLKESMTQFLSAQAAQAASPAITGRPIGVWAELSALLLRQGVAADLVDTVLSEAQTLGDSQASRALRTVLLGRLKTAAGVRPVQPGRPHVCVFVGPTGVGKTTTIAKIAAGLTLIQNYNVCLASADTYRIAAVEQLKVYADIIGVPMEVLYGADEVPAFLQRRTDMDILLVDTAGRSPRNEQQMQELLALVQALSPQEIHFVVAANLDLNDSLGALERFSHIGANRLVLTKLDESQTPGVLLNLAAKSGAPFSYVTMGQSVPDDILEPTPADLAAWVMGERSLP